MSSAACQFWGMRGSSLVKWVLYCSMRGFGHAWLPAGQGEYFQQHPKAMRQDAAYASQASASPGQPLQPQNSWDASPMGHHGSIWSSTPSER